MVVGEESFFQEPHTASSATTRHARCCGLPKGEYIVKKFGYREGGVLGLGTLFKEEYIKDLPHPSLCAKNKFTLNT